VADAQRLDEQRGRHQGGSKWIGTGGISPFGAYGYNPEGIRIGQQGGRSRSAIKVWDERTFRNLDDSVEINTRNIKLLAFAMGASFGGVAGGMFSAIQGFISPESFVLVESVNILAMVVLGGMGNIWGVILGAMLLSFVPEVLRYTVGPVQRALFGRTLIDPEVIRMLLFGITLVAMMLFRPAGLLPSALRKRELESPRPVG